MEQGDEKGGGGDDKGYVLLMEEEYKLNLFKIYQTNYIDIKHEDLFGIWQF